MDRRVRDHTTNHHVAVITAAQQHQCSWARLRVHVWADVEMVAVTSIRVLLCTWHSCLVRVEPDHLG
jgi:hypothetical protein